MLGTRFAQEADRARHSRDDHRHELGSALLQRQGGAGAGARTAGSSNTTGDGGMLMAERENSRTLIYEVLPSRYGINIHHMRMADAIELTIGQGAKPGTGGLLLGSQGFRRNRASSATCPSASTSAVPRGIRISSDRMT